jgi:hypothetical protein
MKNRLSRKVSGYPSTLVYGKDTAHWGVVAAGRDHASGGVARAAGISVAGVAGFLLLAGAVFLSYSIYGALVGHIVLGFPCLSPL